MYNSVRQLTDRCGTCFCPLRREVMTAPSDVKLRELSSRLREQLPRSTRCRRLRPPTTAIATASHHKYSQSASDTTYCDLPSQITSSLSLLTFQQRLNTDLFHLSYPGLSVSLYRWYELFFVVLKQLFVA